MDIKQGDNKFYVEKDSEELAAIEFMQDGDVLTVTHTEVSSELSGQGVGKQLVSEVVQYARNEGKTVNPQCSFARGVIEKTPEFQDVLNK